MIPIINEYIEKDTETRDVSTFYAKESLNFG